jgi:hypothetical protein
MSSKLFYTIYYYFSLSLPLSLSLSLSLSFSLKHFKISALYYLFTRICTFYKFTRIVNANEFHPDTHLYFIFPTIRLFAHFTRKLRFYREDDAIPKSK